MNGRELTLAKLAALATGEVHVMFFDGHRVDIEATALDGFHSGRRRYKVTCRDCGVLVHEATTGPLEQLRYHVAIHSEDV